MVVLLWTRWCVGLAGLSTGKRYRAASARRAGIGAFKRIMISEGAERQSIFYTNGSVGARVSDQVGSVYLSINRQKRIWGGRRYFCWLAQVWRAGGSLEMIFNEASSRAVALSDSLAPGQACRMAEPN